VNVFSLLNHFFRENEREKVSSSATKLYFFLIYEANKSYWEGPLMFSERKLSSLLSFSKNTVSKCLSELEDRGLIMCYPRKGNGLTSNKEDGLTANKEDGLTANVEDSLTANKKDGFTADKENDLTTNREDSLKRPKGGSRKDSLTANMKGKGDSSSAFWFADLELSETGLRQTRMTASKQMRKMASQQIRKEKKEVCDKGSSSSAFWFADLELRETASRQTRMTASKQMRKEKKEVYDKGGSKYAKFF
jgi:DNA-binding transcriptional regulator YhcF (GntR family)